MLTLLQWPGCGCRRERARAVTTVFGGLDVGSAVGLLLCGPLIQYFGWQSVFYLFAALGLVWCACWPLFHPSKSEDEMRHHKAAEAARREQRQQGIAVTPAAVAAPEAAAAKKKPVPWGLFLRSPAVWAIIVAHFCYNWGYYTLLAWLPSYFEMALGG